MNYYRTMRAFSLVLLVVGLSSVFANGQKEQPAAYAGKEGRITVYLSGPADMLKKLEAAFEEDHGDVLDFVQMGCGPLRQRVWTEMEAGQITADVFWGSDPLLYDALEVKGALEAYTPKGAETVKDVFRVSEYYTLINERYGVVIYNADILSGSGVPSSFSDLLNPALRGRVALADPAQSSTALALVAGLYGLFQGDWSFHKALAANGLFLTRKNGDVPMKIQEGEFDAGIAPHDEALRLQKKAKKEGYPTPLAICWPEEGVFAIQRPIGISKNAVRPAMNEEIARSFVDFMVSKKAQMITTMFGFISVRNDLPLPEGVPESVNITRVNWKDLSLHQTEIRDQFKTFF